MAHLKSPCSELSVAFTSSGGDGKRGGIEEGVRDEFVETDSRTVTPKRGHNTLKMLLEMFSLSNFQTKHRPDLLNWRMGSCFYPAVSAADAIFGLAPDQTCICLSLSPMSTMQSDELRQVWGFFCRAERNLSEYQDG